MKPISFFQVSTLQVTRLREDKRGKLGSPDDKSGSQKNRLENDSCRSENPSTLTELARITKASGIGALFSGLSASLVGTTVSQGIYFYLYSLLRDMAVRRSRRHRAFDAKNLNADISVTESLIVAALAGMGNVLLTNPIWIVATRMQAHRRQATRNTHVKGESEVKDASSQNTSTDIEANLNDSGVNTQETASNERSTSLVVDMPSLHSPGPIQVAREIYQEYGTKGFWNGVGPSLVMVINPTIQYAMYEWLSAAHRRLKTRRGYGLSKSPYRPSALEVFLLSALAKAGATVITYPLLTVKTRMMSAKKTDTDIRYTSILDAVKQIATREGPLGFYQGIKTKIVQSVLAASLLFMCKEKITDMTRDLLLLRQADEPDDDF